MKTLSPKQQDILNRENLLLHVARRLFQKDGYHGLTMARVADELGCAKATVYQHFSCKEEIIIALATECVDKQRSLVERGATFPGKTRERMAAVGQATELYAILYADDARIFQVVNGEAITQKVSDRSIWRLRSSGLRTVNVMSGIVRDAIAQGDLTLPEGHSVEDLIYHLWLLGEAGKGAASIWLPPGELGVISPFATIIRSANLLADGYQWRPLSTEWDYEETTLRVRREIFPAECKLAFGNEFVEEGPAETDG